MQNMQAVVVARDATHSVHLADFMVVKEEQVYKRYLTLFNRRIRFPALDNRPVSPNAVKLSETQLTKSAEPAMTPKAE